MIVLFIQGKDLLFGVPCAVRNGGWKRLVRDWGHQWRFMKNFLVQIERAVQAARGGVQRCALWASEQGKNRLTNFKQMPSENAWQLHTDSAKSFFGFTQLFQHRLQIKLPLIDTHVRVDRSCSVIKLAILVCVTIFAATSIAVDTVLAFSGNDTDLQNYSVERFLQEAPPLIKMIYAEDPSTYGVDGRTFTNHVYYEAAWQPPSFYVRRLTNLIDAGVDYTFYLQVVGASRDGNPWVVDQAPTGQTGLEQVVWLTSQSNNRPEQGVAKNAADGALLRLQRARGLWMHLLQPGSLRWIDSNRFEAKASIPPGLTTPHESNCILSGRIVARDEEGRPTRIEYNCFGFPMLGDMSLEFIYQEPVGDTKLPSIIISTIDYFPPKRAKQSIRTTNLLKYVKVGIDPTIASNGYVPDIFVDPKKPLEVLITSNGVNYRVEGSNWTPIDKPPPKPERFASAHKGLRFMFIVTFFALSIVFFHFLVRKGQN